MATIGDLERAAAIAGQAAAESAPATAPTPAANAGAPRKKAGKLTIARRATAGAFLLGWIAVAWVSYQTPYLQTCSEQIVRVGNSALVRSCDPLSLLDAPMLVLLVAGVLLLLPDLSAIEIPGVLRLENQVKEQGRQQAEILRMIQDIKVDVKSNQNIEFKPNIHLYTVAAERGARTQGAVAGLSGKAEQFAQEEQELIREQPGKDRSDDADAT